MKPYVPVEIRFVPFLTQGRALVVAALRQPQGGLRLVFERGNFTSGFNQLQAFQRKVQA